MSSVLASMAHAQTSPDRVTGPLWRDAHDCVWPGTAGGCSHRAPESCRLCDGTLDDEREAAKMRRAAARSAR